VGAAQEDTSSQVWASSSSSCCCCIFSPLKVFWDRLGKIPNQILYWLYLRRWGRLGKIPNQILHWLFLRRWGRLGKIPNQILFWLYLRRWDWWGKIPNQLLCWLYLRRWDWLGKIPNQLLCWLYLRRWDRLGKIPNQLLNWLIQEDKLTVLLIWVYSFKASHFNLFWLVNIMVYVIVEFVSYALNMLHEVQVDFRLFEMLHNFFCCDSCALEVTIREASLLNHFRNGLTGKVRRWVCSVSNLLPAVSDIVHCLTEN
jgi:hypothetical protein